MPDVINKKSISTFRQRHEMDIALSSIGMGYRDEDINLLALKQFEETQVIFVRFFYKL
jgi:hypothetical protein